MEARYMWIPSPERVAGANVSRLVDRFGAAGIDGLRTRAAGDIASFWGAVVDDLGLVFREPYTQVLDLSRGPQWPEWFVGAQLNIVDSCLTRWRGAGAGGRPAVRHEDEAGRVRELTFDELAAQVERAAAGLRAIGVQRGDAVALYLPMIPEAVVTAYAVAALGAVVVPLFSGFAPGAIGARLADARVTTVVTADATLRRGRPVHLQANVRAALAQAPQVRNVVVVENLAPIYCAADELTWGQLLERGTEPVTAVAVAASDTLLLAYTSGTTGKPKGAVHTHAGFLTKVASEVAYSFDVKPGGVFCWITDMGWIMGPLSIFGTHANGATLMLFEGGIDVPDRSRLWRLVEDHRISVLGVSPTLVRMLRSDANAVVGRDLSSVEVIGSTGEPWDEETYDWLARDVLGARVPVINFSGGTEVGGSFLAPYPVEPIASCSLGGPSLGMDVDVVDDDGNPVRDQIGELVCRQPWPSMTRGIWGDEERYLEAYWSTYPGMWWHGDFAMADSDGEWFILGRSDDVMNVAGKRLAPGEVESVLMRNPAVEECAVVGVPDARKGELVLAFWVPASADGPDVSAELGKAVAEELGKPFRPRIVARVSSIPKTTSGKTMRRAIRAAITGHGPGDMSGAAGGSDLAEFADAVHAVLTETTS